MVIKCIITVMRILVIWRNLGWQSYRTVWCMSQPLTTTEGEEKEHFRAVIGICWMDPEHIVDAGGIRASSKTAATVQVMCGLLKSKVS